MSGIKSEKKYTVGYWYGMGAHIVLCHGPVDNILEIKVGDKIAWSGNISQNSEITINNPELFGGDQREGGIVGHVDVMMGDENQTVNSYLKSKLGQYIPAFRGVVSLVLKHVLVSAMNPYIKPWSIRAKRIPKSWFPAYAEINGEANPVHIIHECLTNYQWGMGYNYNDIDNDSFEYAAKILNNENFGISLLWDRQETIERFILLILEHIDGVLYVHHRTGLFVLKLARDDYDIDKLPSFNDSNIIFMEELTKSLWGEIPNQITLVYRDSETDKDTSITVHDLASIQQNGGIVPETINYPGISNPDLANRVAMRELQQLSTPLSKCTFTANRIASDISIGDVIKLSWTNYGIDLLLMRVIRIDYGKLDHGTIKIECVQDVFGISETIYSSPPSSGWVDPINLPTPCPYQTVFEAPYWSIIHDLTGEFQSLIDDIDDAEGMAVTVGSSPSPDALGYNVICKKTYGNYEDKGSSVFVPVVKIIYDMVQEVFSDFVSFEDGNNIDDIRKNSLALIGDEIVSVYNIDISNNSISLNRGILDTVPSYHSAGTVIYFFDDFKHYITPEYVSGESISVKLLTKTARGILLESQAVEMELQFNKRFIRPYCPGNVKINDLSYPDVISGSDEIQITWSGRNRQTQTAYLILQSDGPIIPESGQTTNIYIYDELNNLVHTEYGSSSNHYNWSFADEIAESTNNAINSKIRIKIESARDIYRSWQYHDIIFDRAGYGFHYGKYYGGV